MKTKKILKLKIIILIAVLAVLVSGSVVVYTLVTRSASSDNAAVNTTSFIFDESKAPGWFAGANIDGAVTNAAAAPTSIKLATTTRFIAQGTAEKPTGDCFIQYSYWANNSKDLNQALNEATALSSTNTAGSFTLQPTGSAGYAMTTPAGNTSFQLHQYEAVGPDVAQMSTGEQFAYLKAGTGYIEIRGYCKTADQLSVTLPVLSAVSFKE